MPSGGVFTVEDTQSYTGYVVHIGQLEDDAKVSNAHHPVPHHPAT